MQIGLVIKGLRIERGLKLESLANDLDLATSTLSRIESGQRNPSLEVLYALACAFSMNVSELFDEAERVTARVPGMTREIPSDYDAPGLQMRKLYRALTEPNQAVALDLLRSLVKSQKAAE